MRTADMIKSKFFGARDLQGQRPLVLIIAHVTEELFTRGGTPEMQYFLWFTNHQKGVKLNKTRVQVLETAYGPDSDLWTGRKVRMTFDPTVKFGNVAVGSIKLETEPGVIYSVQGAPPGWGSAPADALSSAPVGRPPAPVWDGERGVWVTQQPSAAPAAPQRPPAPVWNETTKSWETVNPGTGEIARPVAPNPQDGTWGGAPTLSERMGATTAADPWGDSPSENPAPAGADFDDPIPF